jgi:phytoene desaturase
MQNGLVSGLTLGDGSSQHFDQIASNADVVHTYKHMLRDTARGRKNAKALEKKRFSMSLFVIYFGLKTQRPELKHHMVLFGPRYRELISEIFSADTLAEDFSLYLHAPSVTDDSLAPPNGGAYYVLAPVPHLGTADIDWNIVGPKYRDRILQYLNDQWGHCSVRIHSDLPQSHSLAPFWHREFSCSHGHDNAGTCRQHNKHLPTTYSAEARLRPNRPFSFHRSRYHCAARRQHSRPALA